MKLHEQCSRSAYRIKSGCVRCLCKWNCTNNADVPLTVYNRVVCVVFVNETARTMLTFRLPYTIGLCALSLYMKLHEQCWRSAYRIQSGCVRCLCKWNCTNNADVPLTVYNRVVCVVFVNETARTMLTFRLPYTIGLCALSLYMKLHEQCWRSAYRIQSGCVRCLCKWNCTNNAHVPLTV